MSFVRLALIALVLAFTTLSSSGFAQNASSAFKDGLTHWKAGEFSAALPLFRQALASSGSPNARFYVARCLRDLGELPEAYEEMARTVKDARELAKNEARYADTRDAAAGELAVLEGQVGRVIIALDDRLAEAYVTMNGTTVPKERIGVPLAIMPGAVVVAAQNPDGKRYEKRADVAGGDTVTMTVSAVSVQSPPKPEPPVPSDPPPDEPSAPWFSATRGIGMAVTAVGIAGVVLFVVQNGVADDRFATLETECGDVACPDEPRFADLISEGETAQTIGGIALGVGIAAVLGGVAMIVFGAPEEQAAAAIVPHPGGAGIAVAF